jgi:hypothetical protein
MEEHKMPPLAAPEKYSKVSSRAQKLKKRAGQRRDGAADLDADLRKLGTLILSTGTIDDLS